MDQGTVKLAWEPCQDVWNAAMLQLAPNVLSILTSSTPPPTLAHLARRITQVAYPATEVDAFNARKASLLTEVMSASNVLPTVDPAPALQIVIAVSLGISCRELTAYLALHLVLLAVELIPLVIAAL